MMNAQVDTNWLRDLTAYLEQADPEGFLPFVSVDADCAQTLILQYRRQDFMLNFGMGQLQLPSIIDIGGKQTSVYDCLDPAAFAVPTLADALTLIQRVESIRQRTDYPHIRLGRLTTGPAIFRSA